MSITEKKCDLNRLLSVINATICELSLVVHYKHSWCIIGYVHCKKLRVGTSLAMCTARN